jgi:hypothetical protein
MNTVPTGSGSGSATLVKSRLKRTVLINYLVAFVYFFKIKGHSYERSKKPVSTS